MSRTSYLRRPLAALLMAAALAASVVMAAVVLASPAWAATYTVTNNADSGAGSLRQAILDANASSGVADTIDFAPSVSGQTITLATPLPTITDGAGLTIDGGSADITISGDNQHQVFDVGGLLTLSNLTVADGGGVRGNGIYNNGGTLEMSNATLTGNSSSGISNINGTVTVSNSTLSGNSDAFSGGGIFNYFGTVTVSNSTLSGNSANGDAGVSPDGGGIWNSGTLEVSNSTLSGNSANSDAGIGGGISNTNRGTVTVSNSTLSGNSANGDAGGGGIYNDGGTATFKNTIVANSPSGGSCGGTITDGGYNLDSGTSCGFPRQNSSKDPLLGPLADNGGPTLTHALLEGSLAIDKGNSFSATTDQRGLPRPSNFVRIVNAADGSDIGAFELQVPDTTPPKVTSTVPKANANGVAPTANVSATFSEDMDSNSINGTTFKLFKKDTTTQIAATVNYNADTDTAMLDPDGDLSGATTYEAVVTTEAKDLAGNRLDQNSTPGLQQKVWLFKVKN